MYNQDSVNSMIDILEEQIKELNADLQKVEHSVSKYAIKDGIAKLEQSLKNVKQKLI